MEDIKWCKKKLSEYGVELEHGIETLHITARCVPQEEDMTWDAPLEHFVHGIHSQAYHGGWGEADGLVGTLRWCGCLADFTYVEDPQYWDMEYTFREEEETMIAPEPVSKENPVLGIQFCYAAVKEVVVDEDNPYFCARDGVLFSKDMTQLLWYPYGKRCSTYTVPDGVREIGPWAFAGKPNITWVIRKDGSVVQENGSRKNYVKYVYSKSLKRVILPETVTKIGDNAFNHCISLASVQLSPNLKEIQWDAFRGCKELREVEFPDSLEFMAPAFQGCDNLKQLRFLGTRHQLRNWETHSSSWFTTYPGPKPYTPPYMQALGGWLGKKEHSMPEISFEHPWFLLEDGVMLSSDRTELIWCDPEKSGPYTVPDTVSRIGKRAFARSIALSNGGPTQIVIRHPDTVIEENAFFACQSLEQVVLQNSGSVKYIGDHAFHCCSALQEAPLTGVEHIGAYAFFACNCLRVVAVPERCRHIGKKAFHACKNLKALRIPKALPPYSWDW